MKIVVAAAKRTPQGRLLGALSKRSAVDLAKAAGREVLRTTSPEAIDQVILGNVLSAGQGMNMARQVGVGLGIPLDRPAYTVNMMCASGMHAVILAAQTLRAGEAGAILCGGSESMSNAPFLLDRARAGYKLGDGILIDSLLRDGLTDAFNGLHMGMATEIMAEQYAISREAQDAFAARSQQRYATAQSRGAFDDERIALEPLTQDEHPRPDATVAKLSTMKPAFKPTGTITAGNASGINDGAALMVICTEEVAKARGWTPLAEMAGWCNVGCEPALMGLGPVHATRKLCRMLDLTLDKVDTIELNEAFAAQALVCMKELELDAERVNPNGGAIALGHPIGASGARLLVHLACRIARREINQGLATLCVGGGMGSAVLLRRVH